MKYKLFEEVVLTKGLPEKRLKEGDIATVVEHHPVSKGEDGYSLEVFNAVGDTIAIITVPEGRRDTSMKHINFWSPESWQVFCKKNLPDGFTCHHQLIDNLQCAVILRENNRQV